MEFPSKLKYTDEHEWVSEEDGLLTLGLTSYAVEQLGEIVYLELPENEEEFESGASVGTVESTKAVSDIFLPINGTIVKVNENAVATPEVIQQSPYDHGWLIKVMPNADESLDHLMDAATYEQFVQSQESDD